MRESILGWLFKFGQVVVVFIAVFFSFGLLMKLVNMEDINYINYKQIALEVVIVILSLFYMISICIIQSTSIIRMARLFSWLLALCFFIAALVGIVFEILYGIYLYNLFPGYMVYVFIFIFYYLTIKLKSIVSPKN